ALPFGGVLLDWYPRKAKLEKVVVLPTGDAAMLIFSEPSQACRVEFDTVAGRCEALPTPIDPKWGVSVAYADRTLMLIPIKRESDVAYLVREGAPLQVIDLQV